MAATEPAADAVPPDTQAALLLCAPFGTPGHDPRPLAPREYDSLVAWLARKGRRPAELLRPRAVLPSADEPGLPSAVRLRALLARGVELAAALERWHRLGLWVISRADDTYPQRLRRKLRPAAPVLLYGAGERARLNAGGLAVVGARDADDQAVTFAQTVAARCAAGGVQVISGGARGIDRAAVSAALEAGGTAVVAVADRLDRAATARDAKEPIRDGRLTLVSPYDPEAGFSVPRAMGRNKLIYGLADFALVVQFAAQAGGTWAGVVEQLGLDPSEVPTTPVFVRASGNPDEGWEELQRRGALAFPGDAFRTGDPAEVLRRWAVPTAEVTPVRPADAGETCYRRCLPLLLQQLHAEPVAADFNGIAQRLEIEPSQLRAWLERAIGEGKVRRQRKKRRTVYIDVAFADGPGLFDGDGDAG